MLAPSLRPAPCHAPGCPPLPTSVSPNRCFPPALSPHTHPHHIAPPAPTPTPPPTPAVQGPQAGDQEGPQGRGVRARHHAGGQHHLGARAHGRDRVGPGAPPRRVHAGEAARSTYMKHEQRARPSWDATPVHGCRLARSPADAPLLPLPSASLADEPRVLAVAPHHHGVHRVHQPADPERGARQAVICGPGGLGAVRPPALPCWPACCGRSVAQAPFISAHLTPAPALPPLPPPLLLAAEAWVCGHCFRFIGSVEQQIARQVMAGAAAAAQRLGLFECAALRHLQSSYGVMKQGA